MSLISFVLVAMSALAPNRDHSEIGNAIVQVVEAEAPLFAGDDDRRRTSALIVAIAFRESGFRNDVVSKTNDHCALQVNARPDLAKDPVACVRVGLSMLRTSMRVCPSHPIAFYASGPAGCTNARAQRISADRLWLSRRVYAIATAALAKDPS